MAARSKRYWLWLALLALCSVALDCGDRKIRYPIQAAASPAASRAAAVDAGAAEAETPDGDSSGVVVETLDPWRGLLWLHPWVGAVCVRSEHGGGVDGGIPGAVHCAMPPPDAGMWDPGVAERAVKAMRCGGRQYQCIDEFPAELRDAHPIPIDVELERHAVRVRVLLPSVPPSVRQAAARSIVWPPPRRSRREGSALPLIQGGKRVAASGRSSDRGRGTQLTGTPGSSSGVGDGS